MQLDFQARELSIKLIYYGPALSGKTTNLQAIHKLLAPERRSRLMTLETRDDRTLFFDLLPINLNTRCGIQVRIKLFTVPGQVIHVSTRRLVLQGADGVAFIADSQMSEARSNQESFMDLRRNLQENGFDCAKMPIVIQYNKRDLPNIRGEEEIRKMQVKGLEPIYLATATRGVGVTETFLGLVSAAWNKLEQDHRLTDRFSIEAKDIIDDLVARFGIQPMRVGTR
ncbi:MAG: GTPase domain-containing protein [Deltaproteobacteria bacterium]|nr:GTPase domain-containing protein [Deltaproteobacteria bacterium]